MQDNAAVHGTPICGRKVRGLQGSIRPPVDRDPTRDTYGSPFVAVTWGPGQGGTRVFTNRQGPRRAMISADHQRKAWDCCVTRVMMMRLTRDPIS